ncbi:MAG: hypothetical protein ACLFR0_09380, partial [Alphaproteobacteria bacterium]
MFFKNRILTILTLVFGAITFFSPGKAYATCVPFNIGECIGTNPFDLPDSGIVLSTGILTPGAFGLDPNATTGDIQNEIVNLLASGNAADAQALLGTAAGQDLLDNVAGFEGLVNTMIQDLMNIEIANMQLDIAADLQNLLDQQLADIMALDINDLISRFLPEMTIPNISELLSAGFETVLQDQITS